MVLLGAIATSLIAATANAEILAVDFGASTKPVESGFAGQSTEVFTHATGSGDLTVSVKDADGTSTQGFNDKATRPAYTGKDLYRDYIFNNTPGSDSNNGNFRGLYMTLSGPALSANTDYVLEFWVFNEGGARDSEFSGQLGTTGPVLASGGPGGDYGDSGETPAGFNDPNYYLTGTYTSDGSSVLTIGIADGRPQLNGFRITAVPEPTSLALLGVGGLLIARRRR